MFYKVLCVCVFLAFIKSSSALPEGAPVEACTAMRPGHNDRVNGGLLDPQLQGTTPYTIMVSSATYSRNTPITGMGKTV